MTLGMSASSSCSSRTRTTCRSSSATSTNGSGAASAADAGVDDDGLHGAEEGHVAGRRHGTSTSCRTAERCSRPRALRHPHAEVLGASVTAAERLRRAGLDDVLQLLGRRPTSLLGADRRRTWTGCRSSTRRPSTSTTGRAWSTTASWRAGKRSTTPPCRCSARPARSRSSSASPTTRRRSATARASYRATVTTPAPTAARTSSTTSPRSTCRPGCRCTRSTRATA